MTSLQELTSFVFPPKIPTFVQESPLFDKALAMNRHHFIAGLLFGTLFAFSFRSMAQTPTSPDYRFAVRLNTLALINLSAVGELEIAISKRIGVFAGSGIGVHSVDPIGISIYRKYDPESCKISGWGIYTGIRVGLPIGKLVGLSLKGIVAYTHYQAAGTGCISTVELPPLPDPYIRNQLGGYVCVAYAQKFAKRFFIEPVIGIGPVWTSLNGQSKLNNLDYGGVAQLNLGMRF